MKKLDIFNVSEEVKKTAQIECAKLGCNLILISRLSTSEKDDYLYVIMGKKEKPLWEGKEYCVWTLNTSLGGLYSGTYDISSYDAFRAFYERICDPE